MTVAEADACTYAAAELFPPAALAVADEDWWWCGAPP